MKKLLTWLTVGLLTTAILDPIVYGMLGLPVPWLRDVLMLAGGSLCFWLLMRFRHEL